MKALKLSDFEPEVVYELDTITLKDTERSYFQSRRYISNSRTSFFTRAGVFTSRNRVFIVLPWFLKGMSNNPIRSSKDASSLLLDTFLFIRDLLLTNKVSLSDLKNGREFLYYAFLEHLDVLINESLKYNVFRSETQVSPKLHGKWLVQEDLKKSETPVNFTCEINECDQNHSLLKLAKEFSYQIKERCSSNTVRAKSGAILNKLQHVESPSEPYNCFVDARHIANSDRRFEKWASWVEAISWCLDEVRHSFSIVDANLVADITFPTERFFETIVEKTLKEIGFEVNAQYSASILGGSFWYNSSIDKSDSAIDWNDAEERTVSSYKSRADIRIKTEEYERFILAECKYKKLEIVTGENSVARINNLDRNDRNQVLSFLLSSSHEVPVDPRIISVFFPLEHENHEIKDETEFASLKTNAVVGLKTNSFQLNWSNTTSSSKNLFEVRFFGLRLSALLGTFGPIKRKEELDRILQYFEKLFSDLKQHPLTLD